MKGRPDCAKFETFMDFRNVYWCPYKNEPAFCVEELDYCSECKNYEVETHEFICHILKPQGKLKES